MIRTARPPGGTTPGLSTETALVEQHEELGEQLLPWSAALALLGVVLMVLHRRGQQSLTTTGSAPAGDSSAAERAAGRAGRAAGLATVVVTACLVASAVGSTVQVSRIGHSGAKAVWSDTADGAAPGTGEGAGQHTDEDEAGT